MNKTVVFTIITPVFNREDCIGRCIESVVKQQYKEIEHWIVDDGSTDKTMQIVEDYVCRYPFIKYHKFEKNRGVNAARNYAIQNSFGDFIIFLDSDDYFANNALNTISEKISDYPDYPHYLFAQNDRMDYYGQNSLLKKETSELHFSDFLTEKVSGDFAHVMSGAIVRSFPFDENLRIYEYINFLRIFKAGEKQLFFKQVVVNRERGRFDSVTKESILNNKRALKNQYLALKETIYSFAEDYLKNHAQDILSVKIKKTYTLGAALGFYRENKQLEVFAKRLNIKILLIDRLICRLKLGFFLKICIFAYSNVKNK
jgi:glycosyltransferase involved in cell wall biosynthesis